MLVVVNASLVGVVCGCVVVILPLVVVSLWGALAGSQKASRELKPGTSLTACPAKRFAPATRWLRRLLIEALEKPPASGDWLLRRRLEDSLPLQSRFTISCDASPWGGGGVLWHDATPLEYCHFQWSDNSLSILKAVRGSPDYQTTFEFFTVFHCLWAFERILVSSGVFVGGDNLASLNTAVNGKERQHHYE